MIGIRLGGAFCDFEVRGRDDGVKGVGTSRNGFACIAMADCYGEG